MTAPNAASVTTAKQLLERLHRHYIKPGDLPGGIFLPEVGWNGGAHRSRVDALYVGFTSTSGRILVGHELKVSRADWRHELDQAGKADPWADECHAWYVVAPSVDVVPREEVPAGWGLMVPNARTTTRMDVLVRAVVHHDRVPSWNATRSIMARQDTLRAQALHEQRVEARRKAEEDIAADLERRVQAEVRRRGGDTAEVERLRAWVKDVEAALSGRIEEGGWAYGRSWTLEELEAAATFFHAHRDVTRAAKALSERGGLLQGARRHLDDLEEALRKAGRSVLNVGPVTDTRATADPLD